MLVFLLSLVWDCSNVLASGVEPSCLGLSSVWISFSWSSKVGFGLTSLRPA